MRNTKGGISAIDGRAIVSPPYNLLIYNYFMVFPLCLKYLNVCIMYTECNLVIILKYIRIIARNNPNSCVSVSG